MPSFQLHFIIIALSCALIYGNYVIKVKMSGFIQVIAVTTTTAVAAAAAAADDDGSRYCPCRSNRLRNEMSVNAL